ncbi:exo-alpha-sialidase [Thalassoglobus sp.]|uniref:exo-alpha-sialidase n=1 Tax=Thalassoglobus sp. TaxID=2795869 RepID=UPI003AA8011F
MIRQTLMTALFTFSLLSMTPPASAESEKFTLSLELIEKCRTILREGIESDEFWPSIHAAEGLTLAGLGDEVIASLTPKLKTETDDQHRCGLARELVRAGDWQQARIMFEILDKDDSYGHTHASESLFKVFELGDGVGLRRTFAESDKMTTQLMAAAALGRGGSPDAMKFLRKHLANDDEEVRRIAAWIIARVGDKSDIPQLKKNLTMAKDPIAKAYTEHALALLGDEDGQAALKKNLNSDDPAIRIYAATFGGETRDFSISDRLIELLDDDTLDVRVRSAQSLLMFTQPAPADVKEDIKRMVYPATKEHPRYTEGSIVRLANGNLLYAATEFIGGGSDFATAHIVGKESSDLGRTWSDSRVLQKSTGNMNVMSVTLKRLNAPHDDTIALFYLEKNSHEDLRLYVRFSKDEAKTFGERILATTTPGYHVMNNDRVVQLSTGRLLAPVASTPNVQGGGHFICRCWFSDDFGQTWQESEGKIDLPKRGAMEPEVIELKDGRVMMIIRTQLGTISTSFSEDGGNHWSEPSHLEGIIAPEAPSTIRRIPSTGDLLLVWNNTFKDGEGHGGKRTPLTAAISSDEGKTWKHVKNLESNLDQTYSYISLIFVRNRAVMSHWVGEGGKLSSQYRSLPVSWFYDSE